MTNSCDTQKHKVHMVLNVHRNRKAYKGRGDEVEGGMGMEMGEEGLEPIYIYIRKWGG